MGKPALPAFLLNASDFTNDIYVRAMTREERGVYIILLCLSFTEDGLPNDLELLDGITASGRSTAVEQPFNEIWKTLSKHFPESPDGRLRNKRLEETRAKLNAWYDQRVQAGIASGEARKKKKLNGRSTVVEQGPNNLKLNSKSLKDRALEVELPVNLSLDKWREWIEYRSERRLTLSKATISKMLKKLEGTKDPDAVIENSISNGWQGLFPDRIVKGGQRPEETAPARGAGEYQQDLIKHKGGDNG